MILIADSGSTKTAWALADNINETPVIYTQGLNPYFANEAEIENTVRAGVLPNINENHVERIFFYGAGCARTAKADVVKGALRNVFPQAEIHVGSDLLGNARALFNRQKGIVCILGTGSGSGLYDGQNLVQSLPGLGFILGDEGSGAHLGKLLLSSWIKNELPPSLKSAFEERYGNDSAAMLDQIYNKPKPNTWLAGLCSFIADTINDPFMDHLVCKSFNQFFDENIPRYSSNEALTLGFAGSVARVFQKQLIRVITEKGRAVAGITDAPVHGLITYHQECG